MSISLSLTDTQRTTLTAKPNKNKPVENSSWLSSDPAVLTITQDASDPLKALAVAVSAGTSLVTFTADADMSPGITEIVGTMDCTVLASNATSVEIVSGPLEEQP